MDPGKWTASLIEILENWEAEKSIASIIRDDVDLLEDAPHRPSDSGEECLAIDCEKCLVLPNSPALPACEDYTRNFSMQTHLLFRLLLRISSTQLSAAIIAGKPIVVVERITA